MYTFTVLIFSFVSLVAVNVYTYSIPAELSLGLFQILPLFDIIIPGHSTITLVQFYLLTNLSSA